MLRIIPSERLEVCHAEVLLLSGACVSVTEEDEGCTNKSTYPLHAGYHGCCGAAQHSGQPSLRKVTGNER